MKNLLVNIFLVFTLSLMLLSCSADKDNPGVEYAPNMYHSTPYEPLSQVTDKEIGSWLDSNPDDNHGEFYNSNPYNPYGMTMRDPVPNTVKRSSYLPYRIPKDSLELAALIKNPLATTEEVLKEGKVLYTQYCNHCHGEKGMGDGLVGIAYKGVTAYNSRAVKNRSEGEIFHVITHGKGRMWAHGSQVSIENRWKIVKYVQTLQKQ
ncbi:MAG: cytochrome c [Bacteroidota bacterium]|nr:cytochrome c [Bacteroidota bacterium]|tara:strand:- start:9646 stop:10263 length:618 start_codon:yes stop_codon:yes gene_type:complete